MSEPEQDVTVEESGVSVRKSLNDHQFETLAVVFDVRSSREGPTTVSITDTIPEDVPDDDIGFHPEYGGEHWRAEDGQVVFSREFGPGEQYTTVYGVRDFDGTPEDLLAEPTLEIGEAAEVGGIDDLVSAEDSEVVREVISGERDTLPGLEPEAAEPAEAEGAATAGIEAEADAEGDLAVEEPTDLGEPLPGMDDIDEPATAAEPDDDEGEVADPLADTSVGLGADEDESAGGPTDEAEPVESEGPAGADVPAMDAGLENEAADEPAAEAAAEDTVEAEPEETPEDEEDAETGVESVMADVSAEAPAAEASEPTEATEGEPAAEESEDEVTVPVTGGIARVLAKELRAGNVSYEDRRLLREELLPEDGSTDARIQRLQNQVADLAAYTEALEAFLDEEGGAEAVLADVDDRVDALAGDVDDVEDTVDAVEDEVTAMEEDLGAVEADVEAISGDVDDVSADVQRVSGDVDQLEGELAGLRDDVGRIEALDRRIEDLQGDVSAIHDELEELAEFRDRLSSAFGGGMGGGGSDDDF